MNRKQAISAGTLNNCFIFGLNQCRIDTHHLRAKKSDIALIARALICINDRNA